MNHKKVLKWIIGLTLASVSVLGCSALVVALVLALVPQASAPTPLPVADTFRPESGVWVGRGAFPNEAGEEQNLVVFFIVSEDGNQVAKVVSMYRAGPYEQGQEYDGWTAVITAVDITDKAFSQQLAYRNSRSSWTVDIEGTFISSTLLEGTFTSPDGEGRWMAQPDHAASAPTIPDPAIPGPGNPVIPNPALPSGPCWWAPGAICPGHPVVPNPSATGPGNPVIPNPGVPGPGNPRIPNPAVPGPGHPVIPNPAVPGPGHP